MAESVPSLNLCFLFKKVNLLLCKPSTCSYLAATSLFFNHTQLSLWIAQAVLKTCLQLNVV